MKNKTVENSIIILILIAAFLLPIVGIYELSKSSSKPVRIEYITAEQWNNGPGYGMKEPPGIKWKVLGGDPSAVYGK